MTNTLLVIFLPKRPNLAKCFANVNVSQETQNSDNFRGFCNLTISCHIWLFSDENVMNKILGSQKKCEKRHEERFHNKTILDLQTYTKLLVKK